MLLVNLVSISMWLEQIDVLEVIILGALLVQILLVSELLIDFLCQIIAIHNKGANICEEWCETLTVERIHQIFLISDWLLSFDQLYEQALVSIIKDLLIEGEK